MRKFHTYVINIKNTTFFIIICSLIVLYITLSVNDFFTYCFNYIRTYPIRTDFIQNNFPVLGKEENIGNKKIIRFIGVLLNEKLDYPGAVISGNIPLIYSKREKLAETYKFVNESNNYYVPKIFNFMNNEKDDSSAYNPAIETRINSVNGKDTLGSLGITVKNQSGYTIDLNSLYNQQLKIKKIDNAPQILIVHTHGSESYNPTDRNKDINQNVVRIGKEMKKIFEKNNISVIHKEIMHDIPKFNNSYGNTLKTIKEELKNNPTINIVLDIHRDAMIKEDGTPYKVVSENNGKKVSQAMFVVGTNKGGLTHDYWTENLKFAIKCQEEINKLSTNLMRPINIREERFNQHATLGSLIIEVGTNGNTLNESIESSRICAQGIANVINRLSR